MRGGAYEWSVKTVNILSGCPHGCRYCYARANALRFKRIKRPEDWVNCQLRHKEVNKRRRKVDGTVMFPSTHDITPEFLEPCLTVMERILEAGNRLLIVSKPNFDCIFKSIRRLAKYQDNILFRFTVSTFDKKILGYWEPGAPAFDCRKACLRYAHDRGFETSVSIEPILDAENVVDVFRVLKPYVTHSIWVGKMNHIRQRVIPGTDQAEIRRIEAGQTDERIRKIYERLKDEPLVRWKDSCKNVLGLQLAAEAGLDA